MANNKYGKQQVYSFFDNKKVLLLSVNITTAKTFNFSSNNQQQQRKWKVLPICGNQNTLYRVRRRNVCNK